MAKTAHAKRLDGWKNIITALGDPSRDKRMGGQFAPLFIDEQTAEDLWVADDVAATIIEDPPQAMLREGFKVTIGDEEEDGVKPKTQNTDAVEDSRAVEEDLKAKLDELEVALQFQKALEYSRAYGGGALLVGANDRLNLKEPLDVRRLKSVDYLIPLRPRECWATAWNSNPKSPGYGKPVRYRVQRETAGTVANAGGYEVHHSRLLRFDGIEVSRRRVAANRGWGDSVLTRSYEVLRDFNTGFGASAVLMSDFAQAVLKMKGLAEALATSTGTEGDDIIVNRARAIDMARSVSRAMLIDADEEFDRKATPVTGLPELLDRWMLRMAAAARMPVTILFGQAPAGLNATGAADIRGYYDRLSAERVMKVKPKLNELVKLIFLSTNGPTGGKEPNRWTVKFPPMWQMTEDEEADIREKQSRTDKNYVEMGAVAPEEIAVSRFTGDEWTHETKLDLEARAVATDVAAVPFNGIQVEAAQALMVAIASGQLPKETGAKMLAQFFGFTDEVAKSLVEDIKEGTLKPEDVQLPSRTSAARKLLSA
jgi:phage-related protein (TIGR01555 family)